MLRDSLRAWMEEKETGGNKQRWADEYNDKRERVARYAKWQRHREVERKANILDLSARRPLR